MASVLLVCLASYLLGSIPNGLVFGKLLWHVDLHEYGSHNIGATNAWRTLGKGPGFLIFLLDFLKGALSVGLAEIFAASPLVMVVAGILAIVGHSCSLFLHFKGGKGVLVSCSILLVIDPITFCIVIPFFALVVAISKYVSLGSILAAAVYPIITFFVHFFIYDVGAPRALLHTGLVLCTSILLIYMHRSNIQRLRNGTENKFGSKKKDTGVMNDSDEVK